MESHVESPGQAESPPLSSQHYPTPFSKIDAIWPFKREQL